jgi:hypothetical protein
LDFPALAANYVFRMQSEENEKIKGTAGKDRMAGRKIGAIF